VIASRIWFAGTERTDATVVNGFGDEDEIPAELVWVGKLIDGAIGEVIRNGLFRRTC
jgi:hypothetical protein